MPKVSIIIPIYNAEKYLNKSLNSIVDQTLKDIEIICVDDCSTDNSLEILQDYAKKDSRFVILNLETNQGQGIARNRGIEAATGEYIGFVDPDDWIDETMFEKMYTQAKNLDSEIVICGIQKYKEEIDKIIKVRYFENYLSPIEVLKVDMPAGVNIDKSVVNKFLLLSPGYCCNKIYKTEFIKHYKIGCSPQRCYEDVIFMLRSHILASKISYIDEYLYTYVIHQYSTLRSYENRYSELLTTCKNIRKYLYDIGQLENFRKNLNYFETIHSYLTYENADTNQRKFILKDLKDKLEKNNYRLFLEKCKNLTEEKSFINITKEKRHIVYHVLGFKIKVRKQKFNKPVDLVYCWVDGNDSAWQKEKLKWQGLATAETSNMCRFIDNEELKYSLRSVAKNAKWINHIYIVTNGQIPKWLDTTHPKISIVNHKDIMPPQALPTFNSDAIEMCLDNIEGLSEYFIYANDDFYIYSPLKKDYFFDEKGNPILRLARHHWTKEKIENSTLYLKNVDYVARLVKKKYGKLYRYETSHNIDSYRKSYFTECKKAFESEFSRSVINKFRAENSIQRTIHSYYMLNRKHCKLKKIRIFSKKTPLENIYIGLKSPEVMNRLILRHRPKLKLFCINDNEQTYQENRENLVSYLSYLFPKKQPWEL